MASPTIQGSVISGKKGVIHQTLRARKENDDAENQLNPASGLHYYYDGDGHRVAKSDGSRYWYDDNFHVLTTADGSNTLKRDYLYFNGETLGWVSIASGDAHYYLNDHLGSPHVIANGDG